MLLNCQCNISK